MTTHVYRRFDVDVRPARVCSCYTGLEHLGGSFILRNECDNHANSAMSSESANQKRDTIGRSNGQSTAAQEREAEFLEAFLPVSGEHAVPVSYLVLATLGDERHDDTCSKAALLRAPGRLKRDDPKARNGR